MKKVFYIPFIVVFAVFFVFPALAQTSEEYLNQPGYIAFDSFDFFKNTETKVEVTIKGPLLKFAASVTSKNDPELAQLIQDLKLIKVNVFETDSSKNNELKTIIGQIANELKLKNWEKMVHVKDEQEWVEVFAQFDNSDLSGLMVMALDNEEAVFVNIVGKINPDLLGRLGSKFNIPKLDSLYIGKHQK